MHECDPTAKFDDNNLPDDLCDVINDEIQPCASNIATGWAVGGDAVSSFLSQIFSIHYRYYSVRLLISLK